MAKHIEYIIQDTRTGHTFKIYAKDRIDALEMAADMYDLDYDYLEVV